MGKLWGIYCDGWGGNDSGIDVYNINTNAPYCTKWKATMLHEWLYYDIYIYVLDSLHAISPELR